MSQHCNYATLLAGRCGNNLWYSVILYDVGSIFCATFSRASCTALMVAFGVSGNVLVLYPDGASSLGARLSSVRRVPLLPVQSRMPSSVPVVSGLSLSPLSSPSSMSISVSDFSGCYSIFPFQTFSWVL